MYVNTGIYRDEMVLMGEGGEVVERAEDHAGSGSISF